MKIMSFSSCRSIKRILTGRLIIACLLLAVSVTACAEIKGRKIGPVYCIDHADGGQSILSVIETKKDSLFHYHLQLNDSKNASLLKDKEIIVTTKQIEHEQIIGKMRDILWILNDSLTGYDARSLETVATENSMASMNAFMKNNFSDLTNNYLADEAAQVIYLTSANGEGYKLYPNFIILPDTTISDKAPENFSYEIASDYKIYGKFNMKYALSCIDTLADRLYIKGDETETKEGSLFVIQAIGERMPDTGDIERESETEWWNESSKYRIDSRVYGSLVAVVAMRAFRCAGRIAETAVRQRKRSYS